MSAFLLMRLDPGLAQTFGVKNAGVTGDLLQKYSRHGQNYRRYRRIPLVPKIQEELAV